MSRRSNLYTLKGRCDWPYIITYNGRYRIYSSYIPICAYTYWIVLKTEKIIDGEICYILMNGI